MDKKIPYARKPIKRYVRLAVILIVVTIYLLRRMERTGHVPILYPDPVAIGGPAWDSDHEIQMRTGTFLADGKTVALGNDRGLIYIVDTSTARFIRSIPVPPPGEHRLLYGGLAATPDGQLLCMEGNNHLIFFDLTDSDKILANVDLSDSTATYEFRSNYAVTVSPDGRIAAVTGQRMVAYHYSSGERYFSAGDGQGVILFVDTTTHRLTRTLISPTSSVGSASFSPDGTRLAVTAVAGVWPSDKPRPPDQTLLWDIPSGKILRAIGRIAPGALMMSFSKDSNTFAIYYPGGYDIAGPKLDTWALYDGHSGDFVRTVERPRQDSSATAPATAGSPALLPEFCDNFACAGQLINIISPDHKRAVASGGYGVFIMNPTLAGTPSVQYEFFAGNWSGWSYNDVNWVRFIAVPSSTRRYSPWNVSYVYWDGSPGSSTLVRWYSPVPHGQSPTAAEIEHQHRPDVIDAFLNGIKPTLPP